jgi:aldose 1-epimerase
MRWPAVNKRLFHVLLPVILLCICACTSGRIVVSESGLRAAGFAARVDGKQTGLYILRNANGMEVTVTNYGARIVSLLVPDREGHFADVVCGFDSLADYRNYRQNYGATVGRYIGRILNARFEIDSVTYHPAADGNGHCSHGGFPGFADRVWRVLSVRKNALRLEYVSPDGENGFPGTLTLQLHISLDDKNGLCLDYRATTDKPTVLNPSNHSFFNLTGDLSRTVTDGFLWIDADSIAEYAPDKCVTGRFLPVKDSPFDFLTERRIGERIDEDDPQLKVTGGYDHTWKLREPGHPATPAAVIRDRQSGRRMEVFTTEPGMHIYTANGLRGRPAGKKGIGYPRRSAVCFETMHFADSPNKPHLPSTLLRPGEEFRSRTVFRFGVE